MVEKQIKRAVPALVLGLAGALQAQSNVVRIDGSSTVYAFIRGTSFGSRRSSISKGRSRLPMASMAA